MRKSIKVFIIIATIFLVIMLLIPTAYAKVNIPAATGDFYVNDFAEVLSSSEKDRLLKKAKDLSEKHEIQVVVTTVKSLEGKTIEEYGHKMYQQYKIEDRGLLILFAAEEKKTSVEIGIQMQKYIDKSESKRLIEQYAIPYIKNNKANEALISLQTVLIDETILGIENQNSYDVDTLFSYEEKQSIRNAVIIFITVILVVVFLMI